MKLSLPHAFVVLSLFAGLATGANAQSTPSVDRLFDQITLELMAKDYLPRTKPMALQVAPDSEMPAQVALDPAHVYLVVAVCGLGCKNIDIGWAELDAPANTWLRRETQVAQTALLELVPQKKGDYMLAFTTPGCTRAACDFAFRVYYKPRPLSMF